MKKNVLITGGSGFIGSHVVDSLLKNKYRVKILDIQKPRRKDVKFIKGNILNKSIIRSALKDIDIIFHPIHCSIVEGHMKNNEHEECNT